jgi:hypothetical protein
MRLLSALMILTLAASSNADVLGTLTFKKNTETFKGEKYVCLGRYEIHLTIPAKPTAGQKLGLRWGGKGGQRTATIIVNGKSQKLKHGGFSGFKWINVPLTPSGTKYEIVLKADSSGKPTFISGIRFEGTGQPVTITHVLKPSAYAPMQKIWSRAPDAERLAKMTSDQRTAELNGRLWTESMYRCRHFVRGWMELADPKTGLIPRNQHDLYWNAKDAAADNYPFMVLTTSMTDRAMFKGRMREMLRTEIKLTSRIDSLPDTYDFGKKGFPGKANLNSILFGSSEYIKDGLLPLTEWLGRSPWCDRMISILDDMWKHAPVDSSYGKIVSTNVELNGEMLQTLSRIYWMTGDKKYLEWAIRLGDYYLLGDHHPTRNMKSLRLRDHGCEIVSGLCELYAAVSVAKPEKKKAYEKPVHEMLDRILEVGRNKHGMFYNTIDPIAGKAKSKGLADTWGYSLNGFYCVYLVDKTPAYREATLKALTNIINYRNYKWEGNSSDGYADSIESALNLYNRERVAAAASWIDSEIKVMWAKQRPNGVIEGWHGDGNFARTSIMFALWKSQGITVEPWRKDVRVGAVEKDGKLTVCVAADEAWSGKLIFDRPRHKEVMKLPFDWPRINQFPEWFTVEAAKSYNVSDTGKRTGKQLTEGLPVEIKAREYRFLEITK